MIRAGRLIAYTTPGEARGRSRGRSTRARSPPSRIDRLLADPERCVTQAYLVEGRNRVRVYQPEGSPPEGFAAVAPTLEDAYLVADQDGPAGWAATGATGRRGCDARPVGQRRRHPRGHRPSEVSR